MSVITMHTSTPHGPYLPGSTTLSRRVGSYRRERSAPPSAAGMYDWNIGNYSQRSILPGQHNAFPRRLPSASSEKLRQMYLNTDTISGRLVFNSASERNRQRRFSVLQKTMDEQARKLEERNTQLQEWQERQQRQQYARPSTTSVLENSSQRPQVVPPIRSWKGLTIIKESRRLQIQRNSVTEDDESRNIPTEEKVHTEMSIYLPRADVMEDSHHSTQETDEPEETTKYNRKPRKEISSSMAHQQKYSKPSTSHSLLSRSVIQPDQKNISTVTASQNPKHLSNKSSVLSRGERPLTANW